jgi:ABC-type arginine transport system permease subunit
LDGIENKIKYCTVLDHIISLKDILDATSKLKNHKASRLRFRFMVFNVIFNNITVISWRSVLFVEEI